jgi:F0F1-type ATP synthase membrane subunit b/b'
MSDRGTGREAARAGAGFDGTGLAETETRENILGHLLKIEADAAALVDDAQAEADRRIAESEKQNRSHYDEEYARKAAELDRALEEEINRIHTDYRDQLEAYQKSLDAIPVDQRRFSALLDELLSKAPARETFWGRMAPRGS